MQVLISAVAALLPMHCEGEEANSAPVADAPIELASDEIFSAQLEQSGSADIELDQAAPSPQEYQLFHHTGSATTWLAGGGSDGLGILEVQASTTVIAPPLVLGGQLVATPSFGVSFLDGPATVELPDAVYRLSANIHWTKPVGDRVIYTAGVSPGVSTDFEAIDEAFRMFAMGAIMYQWNPAVQFTIGAAYTCRNDIPVLPVAGVTWTPNTDWTVDISIPRPGIARRIHGLPWADEETQDWVYLAGELGGGTWAVARPSGHEDQLTLRDFRLLLGFERTTSHGLYTQAEIGYVFARQIEFEDDPTQFAPGDTLLLRTGASF